MDTAAQEKREPAPPRWLDVELMGHGRIVGRASEVEAFGATWMSVESLCPAGHVVQEKTFNPRQSVYGFSKVSEADARKRAMEDCRDPSHPAWCRSCGIQRGGDLREQLCPACGYGSTSVFPPTPGDAAALIARDHVGVMECLLARASAEAINPDPSSTRPGASWLSYTAPVELRIEATRWALAFHRAHLGEDVEVPPRPTFLKDCGPITDESATNDSGEIPY